MRLALMCLVGVAALIVPAAAGAQEAVPAESGRADRELARRLGIRSTPTIVISRQDGATCEVTDNSFQSIVQTFEEMDSSGPN